MGRNAADSAYGARSLLVSTTITTALTGETYTAVDLGPGVSSLLLEAAFTYGSGGTSATAWVQTQLPSGQWVDVACFGFTTASGVKVANLSARTAVTTVYDATTALTANTTKDGILGAGSYRVKLTTVGTYAGSTSIALYAIPRGH